jgi:hypothetical protein
VNPPSFFTDAERGLPGTPPPPPKRDLKRAMRREAKMVVASY